MLPEAFTDALPRALQHLLEREQPIPAASMSRRTFLKLAGAGGLALGAFPLTAMAQEAAPKAGALKPTQQPTAFVHVAPDGIVTVAVNRLEFGQGVHTALR